MSAILYNTTFAQLPFRLIEAKPNKRGVIYAPPDCTLAVFDPKGPVQLQGYLQCVARFQAWLESGAEPDHLAFERECRRYCYCISKQQLYVRVSGAGCSTGLAAANAKIVAKLEVYCSNHYLNITLIDENYAPTINGLEVALNRLTKRRRQAKHPADITESERFMPYLRGKLREVRATAAAP